MSRAVVGAPTNEANGRSALSSGRTVAAVDPGDPGDRGHPAARAGLVRPDGHHRALVGALRQRRGGGGGAQGDPAEIEQLGREEADHRHDRRDDQAHDGHQPHVRAGEGGGGDGTGVGRERDVHGEQDRRDRQRDLQRVQPRDLGEGEDDGGQDDEPDVERIGSGEFAEGSALPPEALLAEQVGASRLTVREAVKVLASQHVLRPVQGRGTYVNPVDRWTSLEAIIRVQRGDGVKAIAQLVEVRAMIEVGAAELFAGRVTDPELTAMDADLDKMRAAHARTDVGNVHGTYQGDPVLDHDRLDAIAAAVDVPLVLHGASGLPARTVARCVASGVGKINVNTELRRAVLRHLDEEVPAALDAGANLESVLTSWSDVARRQVLQLVQGFTAAR